MAVQALLDAGLERVAYVDLDVHHGNGTQWIFYDEPRVLTVSVHESGRHLFPGSGFPAETGGAGAPGTAANVALPPFAGDDAYRAAWDRVVAPVVRAFGPGAIVAQCGVDHHHADPLSHLLTTMPLYRELWTRLRELADEVCEGRLVALGGGGYEPCTAPPRAWAGLAAELAGLRVDGPVPEAWRRIAMDEGCPEPARGWWEDAGPAADPERDRRAAAGPRPRSRRASSPCPASGSSGRGDHLEVGDLRAPVGEGRLRELPGHLGATGDAQPAQLAVIREGAAPRGRYGPPALRARAVGANASSTSPSSMRRRTAARPPALSAAASASPAAIAVQRMAGLAQTSRGSQASSAR